MSHEMKSSFLGPRACVALDSRLSRLQGDVGDKGHPFSYAEVKPISFWHTIMGHQKNATPIVDFTTDRTEPKV